MVRQGKVEKMLVRKPAKAFVFDSGKIQNKFNMRSSICRALGKKITQAAKVALVLGICFLRK